jgi:hypothetical protein
MTEAVARAGRLRVPVRAAADMIHASSVGVTLTLIAGNTDPELSVRAREAVLAAIATGETRQAPSSVSALAIALTSALRERAPHTLSEAEAALLREWLTRLAVE